MRLDRSAVLTGAAAAGVVAVPAGVVAAVTDGGGALTLVVLAGLVLGAAVAAVRQRVGTPLTHGIVAAVLTFVAVQVVGVVRRTVAGESVGWSRILSSLVLTVLAGALGGLVGGLVASRRRHAADRREGSES